MGQTGRCSGRSHDVAVTGVGLGGDSQGQAGAAGEPSRGLLGGQDLGS